MTPKPPIKATKFTSKYQQSLPNANRHLQKPSNQFSSDAYQVILKCQPSHLYMTPKSTMNATKFTFKYQQSPLETKKITFRVQQIQSQICQLSHLQIPPKSLLVVIKVICRSHRNHLQLPTNSPLDICKFTSKTSKNHLLLSPKSPQTLTKFPPNASKVTYIHQLSHFHMPTIHLQRSF